MHKLLSTLRKIDTNIEGFLGGVLLIGSEICTFFLRKPFKSFTMALTFNLLLAGGIAWVICR